MRGAPAPGVLGSAVKSPLVWLSVLGAVGAAYYAARWATGPRTDSLGRPVRFPTLTVALLSILAVVAGWGPFRTWRLESALSAAATEVAGRPATVKCQGLGGAFVDIDDAAGHVTGRADGTMDSVAHVDWGICKLLRSYIAKDGEKPTALEIIAVHLVTHEARHVAGTLDEATTECEAVQRDALTARALGASVMDARKLARAYWRVHYPDLGERYVSAACRPGGRLDENLPTSPWDPVS